MSNTLELAKQYIKEHEGLRLKKYKCTAGRWTIGYGHLIKSNENYNTITKAQAEKIFEEDFKKYLECAQKFPNFEKLTAKQQIVIVDMMFNLGCGFPKNFPKFTKYLSEGNKEKAAEEIKNSKYYYQVGRRSKNNISMILAD